MPLDAHEDRLRRFFRTQRSVLVALSGGVDSSVLAAIAVSELGSHALAATGVSPSLPREELAAIRALCAHLGLAHETVLTYEMLRPDYVENRPDRCYHCKSDLFTRLTALAATRGIECIVDGTQVDDLDDHRPGRRAANEHGIVSPFVMVGAGKPVVRALARALKLPNADRPAAPCLASRIAYGVPVTVARLSRVSRAEQVVRGLGISECRVRLHETGDATIARIEVPPGDLPRAVENAADLGRALKELGFTWVTLDLEGQRRGSLLEGITRPASRE